LGAAAGNIPAAAPVFYSRCADSLLRSRSLISVKKVFCIALAAFAPGKPQKSRLFSPLSRNLRPLFPHALGGLPAGDFPAAVGAILDVVGF